MRILHIISQTPDFTGSGKFVQHIIAQAGARGHDNFLLAGTQADFKVPRTLVKKERVIQVKFDGVDLPYPLAGMSDAMPYESTVFSTMSDEDFDLYKKRFQESIALALDRFQPDLVHTHHLWVVTGLVRELIQGSVPMVTTCHGTCLRQHGLCPQISRTLIPCLKGIDSVMALNSSQQKEIMELLGYTKGQVPVMAGGYDHLLFRKRAKPDQGRVELVYAGKLCRAKGVPWLLKSLGKIKEIPFRLHLAGEGAGWEKKECLDLAGGLGERVVFHGALNHKDLARLMGDSHLFVLPSFFEGVPLVLMEALACGCRLLATELPGVREILSPADGKMIQMIPLPPLKTIDQPHESDEPILEERLAEYLKQAMESILSDPRPDNHLIAKRTRDHTWEKVFFRIEKVYRAAQGKVFYPRG